MIQFKTTFLCAYNLNCLVSNWETIFWHTFWTNKNKTAATTTTNPFVIVLWHNLRFFFFLGYARTIWFLYVEWLKLCTPRVVCVGVCVCISTYTFLSCYIFFFIQNMYMTICALKMWHTDAYKICHRI